MTSINGSFQQNLSTYKHHHLTAEVWITSYGDYGCRFWKNQVWQRDELYKGKSEEYAESSAENYVLGIKL